MNYEYNSTHHLSCAYAILWTSLDAAKLFTKMHKESISHTMGVSFSSVILAIQGHFTLQMLTPDGLYHLKGRNPWPHLGHYLCVCWRGTGVGSCPDLC